MNPVFGKYIMFIGAVLLLIGGILFFFGDRLTWLGRLPGDIRISGKNGSGFYFPIVTCIVISVLLNLLIGLIRRFF